MKKKLLSFAVCLIMLAPCTAFGTVTPDDEGGADVDPLLQTENTEEVTDPALEGEELQTEETEALPEEEVVEEEETEPAENVEDLLVVYNNKGKETTLDKVKEDDYHGFLYVMQEDASKSDIQEMNSNIASLDDDQYVKEVEENEIYSADSLETIEEVADVDKIEYIEPNYIRHLDGWTKEGKVNKKNRKNYMLVDVDLLWDYGIVAKNVKIAVIDSGVVGLKGGKYKHEDLNYKKISRGPTYAYKKYYPPKRYKKSYANDDLGHGTFVTGEIVAKKGNKKGFCGLAPGAKIISLKAADKFGGLDDADIIKALKQAKKKGAKVVNMSFSGYNYSYSIDSLCTDLANRGIILVAAAGNEDSSDYMYPASYSNVISVSAVTSDGVVTSYSQYNNRVDCAAPGNFYGLCHKKKRKYRTMQGTSMATPVVAAYAAIIKSIRPTYNVNDVRTVIRNTSTDKGTSGKDNYYGYGIVNFRSMYHYLTGTWLYPKERSSVAKMLANYTPKNYTYNNGNAITPAYSIPHVKTTSGSGSGYVGYSVLYQNNYNVGTAKILIVGTNHYSGVLTKTFKILPAGVSSFSIYPNQTTMNVYWNAQKVQTTGYQIRYRYEYYAKKKWRMSKFKTVTIKSNATTSKTLKKLKRNKYYEVQIRTYKQVGKKKYCSAWSSVRSGWTY